MSDATPFEAPSLEDLQALLPDQLEVESLIACGGMGAVYRARQTNLDRLVALKVLPPSIGEDPAYAEKFQHEAKAMAQLSHNNVVGIYDFGKAGPYFYFVMEFVEGDDLHQIIHGTQSAGLAASASLDLFEKICEGVGYAHGKGIVHLDIKPGNVMLHKDGEPKLMDFGLASLTQDGDGEGETMGTPDYAAPERFAVGAAVDHRADIFSLGVMLYEMLTTKVLSGGHVPASTLVAGLPPAIDSFITRCVRSDPNNRFSSVDELLAEYRTMRRIQAAPPVPAAAVAAQQKAESSGGGGILALLVGLGILLVAGGIGAMLFLQGGDDPDKPPVVAQTPEDLLTPKPPEETDPSDPETPKLTLTDPPETPDGDPEADPDTGNMAAVPNLTPETTDPPVALPADSRLNYTGFIVEADEEGRPGRFTLDSNGVWTEFKEGKFYRKYAPSDRTEEYVEMHDAESELTIRLYPDRAMWSRYGGDWVLTGKGTPILAPSSPPDSNPSPQPGVAPVETPELAALRSQHAEGIASEIDAPYEAAMADLLTKYKTAIERVGETARKSGNLQLSVVVRRELVRLGQEQTMPVDRSAFTELARIQHILEGEAKKLEATGTQRREELSAQTKASASQLLETYTSEGRPAEAAGVRAFLAELDGKEPEVAMVDAPPDHSDTPSDPSPISATTPPAAGSLRLKRLHTFSEHSARVTSAAFSPTTEILASSGEDETIRIWDLERKELLQTLATPAAPFAISFSSDGRFLAASTREAGIHIWATATWEKQYAWVFPDGGQITDLRFSTQDALTIFFTRHMPGGKSQLCQLQAATGQLSQIFDSSLPSPYSLAISPDEAMVVLSSRSDGAAGISLRGNKEIWKVDKPQGAVSFSPDGKLLYLGGRTVDPLNGEIVSNLELHAPQGWSNASAALEGLYLLGVANGNLFLFHGATSQNVSTTRAHEGGCSWVTVSRDRIATGGRDGAVSIWKIEAR